MSRALPLFLIGLVFGGGLGFMLAASSGAELSGHDHGDPAHHQVGADHHDHATPRILFPGEDAPRLALKVTPDPSSGWLVHLESENFRFAPEHASGPHLEGEGHAHLYVNGVKIMRMYGPWAHLASLPEGTVQISATLNSNDHRPLQVADRPLTAQVTLTN